MGFPAGKSGLVKVNVVGAPAAPTYIEITSVPAAILLIISYPYWLAVLVFCILHARPPSMVTSVIPRLPIGGRDSYRSYRMNEVR